MSRFSADLQPLVKNVKYSLRQLDEASGPQCFFVCCARLADGKLALLHCTNFDKESSSARQEVSRGMKQICSAFSATASAAAAAPAPSTSSDVRLTPEPSSTSAPSTPPDDDTGGNSDAARPVEQPASLPPPPAPSLPAAFDQPPSHVRSVTFLSPADLPRLSAGVTIPELVGGGYDSNLDADVEEHGLASRSNQGARGDAVLAHRARLDAVTAAQSRVVVLEEELVVPVRAQLCGGEDRRVLLSDLHAFYELMTVYCKQSLGLKQVVYGNLAPVATLGVTVKLKVS